MSLRLALLPLALVAALVPHAATADGGVRVALADTSALSEADSITLLSALVYANVAGSNCAGHEINDAEWSLLTGSADLIADRLGLSVDDYDAQYYGPAFAAADLPNFCSIEGPQVQTAIDTLIGYGGSTAIIPDGDSAGAGDAGGKGADKQ